MQGLSEHSEENLYSRNPLLYMFQSKFWEGSTILRWKHTHKKNKPRWFHIVQAAEMEENAYIQ